MTRKKKPESVSLAAIYLCLGFLSLRRSFSLINSAALISIFRWDFQTRFIHRSIMKLRRRDFPQNIVFIRIRAIIFISIIRSLRSLRLLSVHLPLFRVIRSFAIWVWPRNTELFPLILWKMNPMKKFHAITRNSPRNFALTL